jgi:hypothetical protein
MNDDQHTWDLHDLLGQLPDPATKARAELTKSAEAYAMAVRINYDALADALPDVFTRSELLAIAVGHTNRMIDYAATRR